MWKRRWLASATPSATSNSTMRALARAFSTLALLCLIGAVAVILLTRPGSAPLPPLTGTVERIVIEKSARRMTLWQEGRPVRSYPVALGRAPVGPKERQGDARTPEGAFRIDRRNAASAYTLSLGLNYPRPEDRARARAAGYDPGGDIMIHGQPNALPEGRVLAGDWTAGCIALANAQMREVWAVTPVGTPVVIVP